MDYKLKGKKKDCKFNGKKASKDLIRTGVGAAVAIRVTRELLK
jgi:hypothetical protein